MKLQTGPKILQDTVTAPPRQLHQYMYNTTEKEQVRKSNGKKRREYGQTGEKKEMTEINEVDMTNDQGLMFARTNPGSFGRRG
jgi:hypothetical protein